jgi:hypothetical protein
MQDKNTQRVIRHNKRSDKSLWGAALWASKITSDQTKYISDKLGYSHDKIENQRYVGKLYFEFRLRFNRMELKELVNGLRFSHWVKVARLKEKYNLTLDQALQYLCWAYDGGKTVNELDYMIRIEHDPEPNNFYDKPARLMLKWAEELCNSYGVPEPYYQIAKSAYDALKELLDDPL